MDPSTAGAQRQAEQWTGVAEKLLMARDLEGCKEFASQALAADPRTPGADVLLAAADVLIAAQSRRISNGQPDPYAVLGLDPASPASRRPDAVHSHYRRLSLLLNRSHPDRSCSLSFAEAARLVADSWAFLSDPVLKSALDAELDAAAAAAAAAAGAARMYHPPAPVQQKPQPPPPPRLTPPRAAPQPPAAATAPPVESGGAPLSTFWTVCTACSHIHQYDRLYEGRRLLCPSCRQPFVAEAMAEPPPIVPGTDMYYCTWGFFPVGFPGCPGFERLVNSQPQGPDQPNAAWLGATGGVEGDAAVGAENGASVSVAVEVPAAPERVKPMRVKVGAKKRGRPKGSKNKKNL